MHGLTRVRGLDPGRLALLRHPRAGAGRDPAPAGVRASGCCATSGSTTTTSSCRRATTAKPDKFVGSDEDWAEATAVLEQVAVDSGLDLVPDPGGAAFYGPKISVQAARRDRAHLAALHHPVRLQPAGAGPFRPGVRRRRRLAAAAGDDPLGEVRLDRAVHRRAGRALRRRLPAVAGPGPGAGHPDRGRHADYLYDVARRIGRRGSGSRSTTPTTGCRRRSATPSCRRCRSW